MRLPDVFVRTVKFKGAGNGKGEKHSDGEGLYLLVTKTGKYWRLDYRYLEKRKTLYTSCDSLYAAGWHPSLTPPGRRAAL